jgi:hypothetical protein
MQTFRNTSSRPRNGQRLARRLRKREPTPKEKPTPTGTPSSLRFLWTWASYVPNGERMPKGIKYA